MPSSGHAFHEIYLHINWHCREDRALITRQIEAPLYEFIEAYCRKTKGLYFLKIGGTETHVHLAVQISPLVQPSDMIGKVKGASARFINRQFGKGMLEWQRGYGVVSFTKRSLPAVRTYIERQKEHHASGTTRAALETGWAEANS